MYSVIASWCAARALHCSCPVCCLACLGYVHDTKKKVREKKARFDLEMISARIELAPPSPKSGIVTILPHTIIKRDSRREREVVLTDDGPQSPKEQLLTAIAVHNGPGACAWCGPLLLVLLQQAGL